MKSIHTFSLILGIVVGLSISGFAPVIQKAFAQEEKKEGMTQEEIDKHLTDILESQDKLKKQLEAIVTQTQFLKASSGK
jgi:D-serine dehydratase